MSKATCFVVTMTLFGAIAPESRAEKPESAAAQPQDVIFDADSAFAFLKTMAGDWDRSGDEHNHGAASSLVKFRVTAAGSSVMETIFPGSPMEMISIYHRDGDKLLLTHYCALQNAPVMKFEKSDKPGEIKFVFAGGTNFDPQVDAHVHEGVMQIKDANTVDSSFVSYADGKPDEKPHGTLKRKAGKPVAAK